MDTKKVIVLNLGNKSTLRSYCLNQIAIFMLFELENNDFVVLEDTYKVKNDLPNNFYYLKSIYNIIKETELTEKTITKKLNTKETRKLITKDILLVIDELLNEGIVIKDEDYKVKEEYLNELILEIKDLINKEDEETLIYLKSLMFISYVRKNLSKEEVILINKKTKEIKKNINMISISTSLKFAILYFPILFLLSSGIMPTENKVINNVLAVWFVLWSILMCILSIVYMRIMFKNILKEK